MNLENNIVPVVDYKNEAKYWIDALSDENISSKNKELINKALERELTSYINPLDILTLSTGEYEYDKQEAIGSFGYLISHCLNDDQKSDRRVMSHVETISSFLRNN